MGGSSSRTYYRTVYVERVDTCRQPIIEQAAEQMNEAMITYNRCVQVATSDAWAEMHRQQNELNQAFNQVLFDTNEQMRNRLRADAKFCYNIKTKYKPFGIEGPVELVCDETVSSRGCQSNNPEIYGASCALGNKELPRQGSKDDIYLFF